MPEGTWTQREPFTFWKGGFFVNLQRSAIEYRLTDTHETFLLPYEIREARTIDVLEKDLRRWDFINERSWSVPSFQGTRLINEMRDALSVGEMTVTVIKSRQARRRIDPSRSDKDLFEYLDSLSKAMRDAGQDDLADKTFLAGRLYGLMPGEFLAAAASALRTVAQSDRHVGAEELRVIETVLSKL